MHGNKKFNENIRFYLGMVFIMDKGMVISVFLLDLVGVVKS